MSDELVRFACTADGVDIRERIDRAPLEEVLYLFEHGPAAGVSPAYLRAAAIRRNQLTPNLVPVAMPADRAAFFERIIAALTALNEAGPPERHTPVERLAYNQLPEAIEAVRLLAATPQTTVVEGALVLVEDRLRLPGNETFRAYKQYLYLVTGKIRLAGLRPLTVDGQPLSALSPESKMGRAVLGQGVGARWDREFLSERGNNILRGLHDPITEVDDSERGTQRMEVIAVS